MHLNQMGLATFRYNVKIQCKPMLDTCLMIYLSTIYQLLFNINIQMLGVWFGYTVSYMLEIYPPWSPRPLEAANDEVSRGFVVGWRERRCIKKSVCLKDSVLGVSLWWFKLRCFSLLVFWKISICDLCIFMFVLPRGFKSRWFWVLVIFESVTFGGYVLPLEITKSPKSC